MAYTHGIYNYEQATSLTTPVTTSAGLQIIFGTAPIHLASDSDTANDPKLCYSYAECVAALGYSDDFENYTLCQSMDACFRVFNISPIILVNVLDKNNSNHVTANASETISVSGGEATYNKSKVLLDTMVVKNGDTTLVADTDYIAAHTDDDAVLITLLSTTASAASTLTVTSTSINPAGVEISDIVGSVDSTTGAETGLELVRQIYPKFGLVPGLLLAPGWSHNAVVAAALQAKCENISGMFECNCLIDIATNSAGAKVYTDVNTAKENLGVTSEHAVALWPMLAIDTVQYYYSAIMGAMMASLDEENGDVPYESPSNKTLSVNSAVLEDGTAVVLDKDQGNLLNGQGVVTAINMNGYRAWGNNTAAYPGTTDTKDRWISVRRFLDWDGNNFIQTYFQKVDKPGNRQLIQNIIDSQNIIGNGYVARGYCAGYRTEFRDDENTTTDLLDGKLTLHTYLAPYVPAETLINIREYDVDALTEALGGDE